MAFDETDQQGWQIVTPDGLNYDEKGEDGVGRNQDCPDITERLQEVTEIPRHYREEIGILINPNIPVPPLPPIEHEKKPYAN